MGREVWERTRLRVLDLCRTEQRPVQRARGCRPCRRGSATVAFANGHFSLGGPRLLSVPITDGSDNPIPHCPTRRKAHAAKPALSRSRRMDSRSVAIWFHPGMLRDANSNLLIPRSLHRDPKSLLEPQRTSPNARPVDAGFARIHSAALHVPTASRGRRTVRSRSSRRIRTFWKPGLFWPVRVSVPGPG